MGKNNKTRICKNCGVYYIGRGVLYCSRSCFGKAESGERHPWFGKKHKEETIERFRKERAGSNNAMSGRKHSDETKRKISSALKNPSIETRRKIGKCHIGNKIWLGRRHSDISKRKIGKKLSGKKRNKFSIDTIEKMRKAATGRLHSDITKKKIREKHIGVPNLKIRGENHPNWRGGITPVNHKIRTSSAYKIWRSAVFAKNGKKCQLCMKTDVKFHIDHIKSFAFHEELRFEVSNGRVLCEDCHRKTESYGKKVLM